MTEKQDGIESDSEKTEETWLSHAKQQARGYCDAATTHGFSYLLERSNLVKVIWAGAIIAVFSWGLSMVLTLYLYWGKHPVTIVVEDTMQPIQNVQVVGLK